jgi:L-threonylcarbamoyladenylate synthase
MRPSIIRKINSQRPEPEIIAEAAAVIKQGGVIAFPTRCLYGLGADAFNQDAVERMIQIKQRPEDKPILVLIDTRNRLERLKPVKSACAFPDIRRLPLWLNM